VWALQSIDLDIENYSRAMAGEKWIDAFFGYTQGLKKPVMYLVNAFVDPNPKSVAGPRFSGNPAAVCLCSSHFTAVTRHIAR
jgi:hypothetical protein